LFSCGGVLMDSHLEVVAAIPAHRETSSPALTEADLILAILHPSVGMTNARDVLAAAAAIDVDPLDYCARRGGLSDAVVLERAARWAGLRFSASVPRLAPEGTDVRRPEALAGVRVLRAVEPDRDKFYLAPRFEEMFLLRDRVRAHPELADQIHIVPGAAIRSELAASCAAMLIDESRQRLTRKWPFATAHLDLGAGTRAALVAGMAAVVAGTLAAPFVLRELLLPMACLLLGLPAAIRIWAIGHLRPARPAVRLLSDAELPAYTVLVPLRNEAGMVPQLGRAMAALDYPALCSKRTNA
jgi:hypothetical protein